MQKSIIIVASLFVGIIFMSCNLSQDIKIKVTIENNSTFTYDSIRLYVYSGIDTTLYKVKPNEKICKNVILKNFSYPRGERLASSLIVFKDDYYTICENGLIDYPLEEFNNEYKYFIRNSYITIDEKTTPINPAIKHRISEYIRPQKR